MINAAVNSVYQSPVRPVRRFSTDAKANKENNSPLDINRLKKLLKKTSDESRDVLALLKNGTMIKVCKPLANIDKNTIATHIPVRARKPAQPKDDTTKPNRAVKKTTTATAKAKVAAVEKPKPVSKATGAATKKTNTTEESQTSTNQTSVQAAKAQGAIKKTTIAKAKEGAKENLKPKRVQKPKEATAKKVTITEPETSVGKHQKKAIAKKVTITEPETLVGKHQKEATAKKVTITEPETSVGHASAEAKPKRVYKKRVTAKSKEESADNQKLQNEATKNIKEGNKIDQKKAPTLESSIVDKLNASTEASKLEQLMTSTLEQLNRIDQKKASTSTGVSKIDQLKASSLGPSKINQLMESILGENKINEKKPVAPVGASKIDQLMAPTVGGNKIDQLMASTSSNLNNLNIKSEPAMQHNKSSNSKFNLSDSKVKKETTAKKPNCAVAKKVNTIHEKTVKKLNTTHEKTAKKLNTTHEKNAKKLNTTHDKTKKLTSSKDLSLNKNKTKQEEDHEHLMDRSSQFDSELIQYKLEADEPGLSAGLKISKQHITFRNEKSKQAKGKKDKKARDKFKNDIKVAEAIEKMTRYFSNSNNVNIGNVAGHCLSSSSSEYLSDCSCNNESLSSSDHTHCNCWNCQLKSSSDDSSWTKTSSDSSDNSDDSEATSSTESSSSSSSSSSDDSKKRSKRSKTSCKKYNLRNRRK